MSWFKKRREEPEEVAVAQLWELELGGHRRIYFSAVRPHGFIFGEGLELFAVNEADNSLLVIVPLIDVVHLRQVPQQKEPT